jgi:DNA-binding CsgD family transcriptional regulator
LGGRAIKLAEQLDDIETLIHALSNIGSVEMSHDQVAEGQIKLERSLRLSLDHDYHNQAGRIFYNLASELAALRDYETCLIYVNEGFDYCDKHDLDHWRSRVLSLRARVQFEQGHWDELETSSNNIEIPFLMLQLRRGNPISRETLDALRKIAESSVFQERLYPIAALFAEMAWLEGNLTKCLAEVEPIFQIACQLDIPRETGELAYWMWRAGAIQEAPIYAAEPYATQIAGNWREAALMWEKFGCPYEQAMALMDGDEAAQLAALEIFERLGARPIIHKLKQKMHAKGIRIPHRFKAAAHEGPGGLTAREIEILRWVSQGLSNQEIADRLVISRRTVHAHLRSLYDKLNVTTRTAAVHEASRFHLF